MNDRFKNSCSSQSGFTLSGAMIALGVVSILGLILAQFSSTASRIFSDIEKSNAVTEIFTELRFTLADREVCKMNFQALNFNTSIPPGASAGPRTPVPKVASYGERGGTLLNAGRIIEKNQIIRGLTVTELQLVPITQLSSALVLAELQATFKADPKNPNSTNSSLTRSLPLLMRVKNDKIQECWVRKPYDEMVYNTICSSSTDGSLNAVETSPTAAAKDKGQCTLANGQWFQGSTRSATCPAGTFLTADSTEQFNCRPVIPPTFTDPFPLIDIPATDGSIITAGRKSYVMTLDKNSRTCHCNWATDLSAQTIATFRCEVLCLVPQ